jgi:hypothetical protein
MATSFLQYWYVLSYLCGCVTFHCSRCLFPLAFLS